MVRLSQERVLLIGDADRQMYATVMQALPAAHVKCVLSVFDAIAELTNEPYSAILAAVEPMERRPESATSALREVGGQSRLLLFGDPSLEPLSQKLVELGCDDYLITPATPGELLEALGSRRPRNIDSQRQASQIPAAGAAQHGAIPLADLAMEALIQSPCQAVDAFIKRVNEVAPAGVSLTATAAAAPPEAGDGQAVVSRPSSGPPFGAMALHLTTPADFDPNAAADFLAACDAVLAKVKALQDRHVAMQRLAITDELTGLYNARYLRHFLGRIIEKARVMRFPVTLLIFDIDKLKKYNDEFGHAVGDEILKQTAALMKRCCRDHDLVARMGGDEFAVVFWEKEGPRQPRDPRITATGRTPQEPQAILDRFRALLSRQEFPGLGPGGKGSLTISGGLAVYPFDGQDVNSLITAADHQLMFGAKRSGRNQIHLVGGGQLPLGQASGGAHGDAAATDGAAKPTA